MHSITKGLHPTKIAIDAPTSWGTDCYGVHVDTVEYEPYAEPGQFLIVSAMTSPRIGQKVFVNTHRDVNHIGKLVARDETSVTLRHPISQSEVQIPMTNINNLHLIKGVVFA